MTDLPIIKFNLDTLELYRIIFDIKSIGKNINIISKYCPIVEDDADNLFINLAIDGNVRIIVSGDSHLITLKEYRGIEIITVSEFLNRYK